MIELTFSDSTAGTLKTAKQLMASDPTEYSPLLDGSPEDVLPLTLDLDIGDLCYIENGMSGRQNIYDRLFAHFPGVAGEIMKINRRALDRLSDAKKTTELVRIWVSALDPSELCGLYYVCHLFADAPTSLSMVRIPNEIKKERKLVIYHSTGEVALEDFETAIEYEEPISDLQREFYAGLWRELAAENAPLRAMLNGRVVGVPEDFYDFALRAEIPEGEFRVAQLLGNVLNKLPGVSDSWLYMRLSAIVASGTLVEVSPPDEEYPYSGILKRGGEHAF
jgi:hypothetical protein